MYTVSVQCANTSKNKQVILEEYQPHKSILTEPVKVKFAIKPAKTDSGNITFDLTCGYLGVHCCDWLKLIYIVVG